MAHRDVEEEVRQLGDAKGPEVKPSLVRSGKPGDISFNADEGTDAIKDLAIDANDSVMAVVAPRALAQHTA